MTGTDKRKLLIIGKSKYVHYVVGALDQATIRTVGDLLGTSASY